MEGHQGKSHTSLIGLHFGMCSKEISYPNIQTQRSYSGEGEGGSIRLSLATKADHKPLTIGLLSLLIDFCFYSFVTKKEF